MHVHEEISLRDSYDIFCPFSFSHMFQQTEMSARQTIRAATYRHRTAAVLQAEGDPLAAIPTLVGIFCGHVYHFFTVVHPLMGAKRRLGAPAWMKRRLDGGDNPNFMETPGEKPDSTPHVDLPSLRTSGTCFTSYWTGETRGATQTGIFLDVQCPCRSPGCRDR